MPVWCYLFEDCIVIVGEIANFAVYAFAPAILVIHLETLSIYHQVQSLQFCRKLLIMCFSLLLIKLQSQSILNV